VVRVATWLKPLVIAMGATITFVRVSLY